MGDVIVRSELPGGGGAELFRRHNVVAYSSADILARMIGGQHEWAPRHVGFIYAPAASLSLSNPDDADPARLHDWGMVASQVEAAGGNMVVSPVARCAEFSSDGEHYECNVVTLRASSASGAPREFQGGGYLSAPPTPMEHKFFQAVLLARFPVPGSAALARVVYARVQLAAGAGGQPVIGGGAELSVQWPITFK
jgi:hypothetical protein